MSIDVSAADPVYKQLTPTEAYAFYGDSIEATYYSQSGYKRITLYPSSNRYAYYKTSSFVGQDIPDWLDNTNLRYVWYGANVSDYSQNPSYLGLDISPNVHFSDCTALRFAACGYLGGSHVSSSSYEASFINLYAGGQLRFENGLYTSSDNYYPEIQLTRGGGSWSNSLVWADYASDTVMDVSMVRVGLNGVRLDGGSLGVYLLCPLVNDSAVPGTGVVTGTTVSGTGDINVNVDVDLTETNSWLENIFDGISNIGSALGNAISRLFLPDEQDIINWKQTIVNILNETFGGIPELEQSLKDAISSIFSASARETVTFEGIKVPAAAGEPEAVIVPRQEVRLKPNGFDNLFLWVEMFINIVATIAIANTCFNQVKRVIVGEVVVDAD